MILHAKKSYGQNFLIDMSVVQKIIQAAQIKKGEVVLEIGPGTGVLTEALIKAGAKVIAVEADHDLIKPLKEKFKDTIELIEGNVMSLPLLTKEGVGGRSINLNSRDFKLIANIPYNITSTILERFLCHEPRPSKMVLMLQKEVAERILAKPPNMSLLTVVCQLYATCSKVATVKAGAFRPIPKVDSAVVQFDVKLKKDQMENPEKIIAVAKVGFASRRKQLHHNLQAIFSKKSKIDTKKILVDVGLDPKVRAENLTIDDWVFLEKRVASSV